MLAFARGELDAATLRGRPDWPALREAIIGHGLTGTVVRQLDERGVAFDHELRLLDAGARARRLAARATMERIRVALDALELAWVVLKGPAVASRYEYPSDREYHDLDVLVRGSQLGGVLDALADAGMDELNRNWSGFLEHGVAELPIQDGITRVDLHWHLVGRAQVRRRFAVDPAELLDRRVALELDGTTTIPALDPVDNLIHVALHAALGGGYRLSWLCDVAVLARSGVDGDALVRRCRAMRVRVPVGHVLDRARLLVAAPVPDEVIDALVPTAALRIRRRWDDRPTPMAVLPQRIAPGFPLDVGRDGVTATAAALRVAAASRTRRASGRPDRWDVEDPGSPIGRDGRDGDLARTAYLNYAAS